MVRRGVDIERLGKVPVLGSSSSSASPKMPAPVHFLMVGAGALLTLDGVSLCVDLLGVAIAGEG